jgi:hypothetical protein
MDTSDLRQEPGAGKPRTGICGGGAGQPAPLPDCLRRSTARSCSPICSVSRRRATRGGCNVGYRRFLAAPEGPDFTIDPAKVEAEAQFDSLFVLRTSMKPAAPAIVLRYRNLLAVESSFQAAKALLATRPMFHRTDGAIRVISSACFWPWCCARSCSTGWLRAAPRCRNGSRSSTIWRISALSRLSRMVVAHCYAPRHGSIDPICLAVGVALPPVFPSNEMQPDAP